MTVETAADRAILFNPDEWGEAALWSSGGQWDPVAVSVILSRDDQVQTIGAQEVQSPVIAMQVRLSELPAWAARGDRIVITSSGEDFEVVTPLERDELAVIARAIVRPSGA